MWDPPPQEQFQGLSVKRWLLDRRTPFQHVKLAETLHFGKILVVDGSLQSSELDEFIYHEALVHPALLCGPMPEDLLVLGGGEGACLREVLRYRSLHTVTMVDIDRELVEICRSHLPGMSAGAFHDPRVKLVIQEAREFLRSTAATFDVIVQDLMDPPADGSCDQLFTLEFFAQVRHRLRPGGRFVVQCGSASLQDLGTFSLVVNTLRAAFPQVFVYCVSVPSYGAPWGFALTSCEEVTLPDACTVDARIEERIDGPLRLIDGASFSGLFLLPRYVRAALSAQEMVLTEEAGRVARLAR
ncbi:MAG: fused MFS/spermidine synthase [Planctomycetota bacterium]